MKRTEGGDCSTAVSLGVKRWKIAKNFGIKACDEAAIEPVVVVSNDALVVTRPAVTANLIGNH